jgi:hypothetical protein
MKVGDLIIERAYPEDIGLVVEIRKAEPKKNLNRLTGTYVILNQAGETHWFASDYIEEDCEVVSESR